MDKPHLVGKLWYYGTITRAQCDTVLNKSGQDGDFLVRDSETNVNILHLYIYIIFILHFFLMYIL